jgi:hypothetical protein
MGSNMTRGSGSGPGSERGVALITVMMIMLLMSALMIGFATITSSDQRFRGIDKDRMRAFYGATSGLEKLTADLGNLFLTNVAPTPAQIAALADLKPTIPQVTFSAPSGVTAYGVALIPCNSAGATSCNGTVSTGPYAGLIALKKMYSLDAMAHTALGGEAHLNRKLETVAIPVFQFGTFSDVDLSFFAGANFNFGGRVHTNGNLFLAAQTTGTTTITDKVTAVGDVIRARMQNGNPIVAANFNGTLSLATATNSFRNLLINEGSLIDGVGSAVNVNWPTVSLSTYNGYVRNGGCPPVTGCSTPPRGTGAKPLNLPLITVGGSNPDLTRRAPANEITTNPVLFGERLFGKVSLRILLSDTANDITSLPTVTPTPPVRLGDEGGTGAGLTNDWFTNPPPASNGVPFLGVNAVIPGGGGTMPPIARSPGLQTITTSAGTNAGDTTIPIVGANPTGVFNVPACLGANPVPCTAGASGMQFQIQTGAPLANQQRINCLSVTAISATQIKFVSCKRADAGGNLLTVPPNASITITDINGRTQSYLTVGNVAGAGTNDYTVTTTAANAALVTNSFWMQSTAAGNNLWSIVTCYGITTATNTANAGPFGVTALSSCNGAGGVPKTAAGANVITTAGLNARDTGTIGGYIKIEIQRADATWQDVTMEILNWGFADKNQEGANCGDPTPNAIIRLQRLRDTNTNATICTYANSTNSYDYWPNTIFDTREALLREPAPANNNTDLYLGGVMHYVTIDVANLSKWFKNTAPYGAGSGNQVLLNNGYSVYFSDRRNNRDLNNQETGEYGFEDVVNPLDAAGLPNNTLDAGEDLNANGTLETYGKAPNFLGVKNTLPTAGVANPAPFAAFNAWGTVLPTTTVGRSAAMTNRAYLFRRALKLINGGFGNVVTPGFTVVTENPVYIQGDWNWNATAQLNDPHSETAVIADAVTLLSNAWTDSNSFVNPYNSFARVRVVNWYRLAVIGGKPPAFAWPAAGNPDSTFGTDGGAQNFLRYLEGGNGLTTNYRGAIATFFYSRQGTGTYKFGTGVVYNAPNRAYNFDIDFLDPAKLPPLTPVFRDINMLGFAQEMRPGK